MKSRCRFQVRIGVDDSLQLSFLPTVPIIAVRVVAADEAFVGAADIGSSGGIGQPQRRQCLRIAESGPAAGGGSGLCARGEQVMRIAEGEGGFALRAHRLFPASQRALGIAHLVRRQAIEEIIARVEFADMIEAQELPATFAARQPIRPRRAKFAGQRAPRVVAACRFGAFDAAMQALRALRRFR